MPSPRVAGRHYTVVLLPDEGVLHCVAPKSVFPRAVDRNREKRRCRAILQGKRGGYSVKVIRPTTDVSFAAIKDELCGLVARLGRG